MTGGPSWRSRKGRGTLRKVRDGSRDAQGGLKWFRILPEVWDGLGDTLGGPEHVSGHSQWSRVDWVTFLEVRDRLEDRLGGPGLVWRSSRRS